MTHQDQHLLLLRIFSYGGPILIAAICIFAATREEANGPFKWFLWLIAISLLLLQAGCLMLGQKLGTAASG